MGRARGGSLLSPLRKQELRLSSQEVGAPPGAPPLTSGAGSERCSGADVGRRRLWGERVLPEVGKASGPGLGPANNSPFCGRISSPSNIFRFLPVAFGLVGSQRSCFGYRQFCHCFVPSRASLAPFEITTFAPSPIWSHCLNLL